MLIVPLQSVPNQTLDTTLGTQLCQLDVYQTGFGLFMNVYVSDVLILAGVLCENLNLVVRSLYLGFSGDFVFFDTQGTDDPFYTGLGTRFLLAWLAPSDLPAGQG